MRVAVFIAGALVAAPALAEDDPRFCPNRPSLGSSACTTEPGYLHFEVSAADWERDTSAAERQDTEILGDFQARFGVGPATELQIGWTPVGLTRTRDISDGKVTRVTRAGDVRLGIRQAIQNPDGKGLSFGIEPFVTVPVGRSPIGAGDWEAGAVLPITYRLTDKVSIGLTNEADASLDADEHGRHLVASSIVTIGLDLGTPNNPGVIQPKVIHCA